jgi:hypothetical protein
MSTLTRKLWISISGFESLGGSQIFGGRDHVEFDLQPTLQGTLLEVRPLRREDFGRPAFRTAGVH